MVMPDLIDIGGVETLVKMKKQVFADIQGPKAKGKNNDS